MRRQFTTIDAFTQQLIQQRNMVRRQFQRSGCPLKKLEPQLLNRRIWGRMTTIRNQQFSNSIWQVDDHSRPFWKVVKILKKWPAAVPPLKDGADGISVSPPEKDDAIAGKLVQAYNLGANMVSPPEATV